MSSIARIERRRRSTTTSLTVLFLVVFIRLGLLVSYKDAAAASLGTFTRAFQTRGHGAGGCSGLVMLLVVIHAIVTSIFLMPIISMIVIMLVDALRDSTKILTLFLQEEVVACKLLFLVHLRLVLVDTWSVRIRITAESDVKVSQELVTPSKQTLGSIGPGVN